jgi:glycosyltransferase involved in cell wall biosynthesis
MKPRLLIVTSHPIQYQVPWFRALQADGRLDLQVLFLSLPDAHQQGVGFGYAFDWDVPLLEGYNWAQAPSAKGSIREGWWGLRLLSAAKDISAHAPDAVLISGWQNRGMLQCLLAARRLALPVLLRAESNGLGPLGAVRRLKNRWIARQADQLLPIGQANRRFYARLGLDAHIGPEVAYFVDNDFFAKRSAQRSTPSSGVRSKWGIPEAVCCFLFAGKLVSKKRPQDLLAALERIHRESPNRVHLLIVGTGPLESELRTQVEAGRLPVTFAGFLNQTEIPAAYAAADCLVLPSDYGETWGLVVNEAMACGVPAIVSDRVGCGPDLVHQGVTGLRFPFGDIERLAESMVAFMALSGDQRREMGSRAQRLVFEKYSIKTAVQGTIQAVSQVSGAS